MSYKGLRKPLREIAQEVDVDVIVSGTVRRDGGRVRITAQLVDVGTDRVLWAQSFERELRDVLSLQSDFARSVAGAVEATLTPEEKLRFATTREVDPAAHDAYLRGSHHLGRLSVEDLEKIIDYLELAIRIDPDYGEAYGALALVYSLLPNLYLASPEEGFGKAKELAMKALALDEMNAVAHLALAWSLACHDYRWAESETAFRRAIELEPSSALAHRR